MLGISPRDGEAVLAPLISEPHFKLLIWLMFGISIVAFFMRMSIRLYCFRRLLVEDYLMIFVLCIYTSNAVIYHLYLSEIYTLWRVSKGIEAPTINIVTQTESALRAEGIIVMLTSFGVWVIKLNYLFFFRRLTRQIRSYILMWRAALAILVITGIVNVALTPYQCTFGSFMSIIQKCENDATINHADAVNKTSVGLDVATDCLLIAFPIIILWPTKLRLSQKLLLSGFFSFTLLTIGVTVVRGSSFGAQFYQSLSSISVKVMDFVWITFWYWVEFSVSFAIANLVSFRSLFTSREQRQRDKRYQQYLRAQPRGGENTVGSYGKTQRVSTATSKRNVDNFYANLLETVRDWEGAEPELDVEREYVALAGITKTVDLMQRTSLVDESAAGSPGIGAHAAGSRASQSALAAYCYYEASKPTHDTIKPTHDTIVEGAHARALPITPREEITSVEMFINPAHIARAF